MTNEHPLPREQARQVCRNLGALATRLNVAQQTITKKTGYLQPNIARLYSGRVSPRIKLIYAILQAINESASTNYILRGVEFVEGSVTDSNVDKD